MKKSNLRPYNKLKYQELSIINQACAVLTSSLNVPEVFDSFILELKNILDINWAAITITISGGVNLLASYSDITPLWKAPDSIPIKGTATEWVVRHKRPLFEPDLQQECRFVPAEPYHYQRVRSVAHLPLTTNNTVIGTLVIASRQPDAYRKQHIPFLKLLAAQIVMPIEHSLLYAEAREQARVDKLTGLSNRRSLDEVITSEIDRHARYGGVFSLIILDLDLFKKFNDELGHLAGDDHLRKIGVTIKDSIRSVDMAFRYGGDEFAIILPNTTPTAGKIVAERIRKQIAAHSAPNKLTVTASLGLAAWPGNGHTANELIAAADIALYQAKQSGGGRCQQA